MDNNTVAEQELTQLDINDLIDPNFGKYGAFLRAMKLFQKAFYPQININEMDYMSRYIQFLKVTADLFDVTEQQLIAFDSVALKYELFDESVILRLSVVQFRPRPNLSSARVVINFGHLNSPVDQIVEQNLNVFIEDQYISTDVNLDYDMLVNAIEGNLEIKVNYFETYWDFDEESFGQFVLPYNYIHCDGFRQWLTFGESSILVNINFDSVDNILSEEEISSFHLHTIVFALQKRLNHFRAQPQVMSHIHQKNKRAVTDLIGPTNAGNQWWDTNPDPNQPMKYTDLQIGFKIGERLDIKPMCVCNEFCNWNAFFHFNPIYRFLLVQHNLHYIDNRTNVAQMYLTAVVYCLRSLTGAVIQRTPLFRLLRCAEKRIELNSILFLKDRTLCLTFQQSYPDPKEMEALSYLMLRFHTPVADICRVTDGEIPFFDHTFGSIERYYKTLTFLHTIIGQNEDYVEKRNAKTWKSELEAMIRLFYHQFVEWSYQRLVNNPTLQTDLLFTSDAEYSSVVPRNEWEIQMFDKWILHRLQNNPLNVEYSVGPMIDIVNKVWKYIAVYELRGMIYFRNTLAEIYTFLFNFERVVSNLVTVPDLYRVVLTAQGLSPILAPMRINLLQLYKLKMYSQSFTIQRLVILIFAKRLRLSRHVLPLPQQVFNWIWSNHWMEDCFLDQNNTRLFSSTIDVTRTALIYFREQVWHIPNHKMIHLTLNRLPTMAEFVESVINEYSKRRFWDRINGRQQLRFAIIWTELQRSLELVQNDARLVLQNHIVVVIRVMKDSEANLEPNVEEVDKRYVSVLDELVYRLVRSACFVITRQMSLIVKHCLQSETIGLLNANINCSLCDPTFFSLFSTRADALNVLEGIRTEYQVFDDPFERIRNAIENSVQVIKVMFRNVYQRLSAHWTSELARLSAIIPGQPLPPPLTPLAISLHTLSGMSFIYSLVNFNRYISRETRKLLDLSRRTPYNSAPFQAFSQLYDSFTQWVVNVNRGHLVNPFIAPHWETNFAQVFQAMDQQNHNQIQIALTN